MTAPPRLPVRTAYRNRANRPPPRLNLNLLDSPDTKQTVPMRDITPPPEERLVHTPRRRTTRTTFQQRLVSIYFRSSLYFFCRLAMKIRPMIFEDLIFHLVPHV